MPFGHASPPTAAPKDEVVLQLVERLESEGRLIDVVRLTEKWGFGRSLPRPAMLASARALLSLRMMDRALARLRTLTDANPQDIDALLLMVELMIERGWTARARRTLDQLMALDPEHPLLPELEALVDAPPQQLLSQARNIERGGSRDEQCRLAEMYLATGSILRGKNLLERLRRQHPEDERITQLLWGAQGDHAPKKGPLQGLIEELTAHDDPQEEDDEWGAPEQTESTVYAGIAIQDQPLAPAARGGGNFPLLFRGEDNETTDGNEAEVTMAAHMASGAELADVVHEEVTESSIFDDDADTRILEIIHNRRDEEEQPEPPASHAVNLRAFQGTADPETDFGAEDDDIVVMNSVRSQPTKAPASPTPPRRIRPIEVIEKHPVPVASSQSAQDDVFLDPGPVLLPDAPDPSLEIDLEPELRSVGSGSMWLVIVAALLASMGVVGVYMAMQVQAGRQVRVRTAEVLAEGNFGSLKGLDLQLTQQVEEGKAPLADRAVALALVNAVLWSEYTGDFADREQALESVQIAEAAGAEPEALATVRGILALSVGDVLLATDQVAMAASDDESNSLRAKLALLRGDQETARAMWPSPPPAGERYANLGVLIAGEDRLPDGENSSLEMIIVGHEKEWDEAGPAERLADVTALLSERSREMSPRQRARLYAVSARMNSVLGRESWSREAWEKALEATPGDPQVLYAVASRDIAAGQVVSGVERLQLCQQIFTQNQDCRRAHVAGLLELDRLEDAAAAAGEDALMLAWVAVVGGEATTIPEDVASAHGLRDFLLGLQAAAGEDEEGVEAAMTVAQIALKTSPKPELRVLSDRALAVLVEHGRSRLAATRVRELLTSGSVDPAVHLRLARYHLGIRQRTKALQQLAHATQLTDDWQSAATAFALGEMHREEGQLAIAQAMWDRYRMISPSGDHLSEIQAMGEP